MSSPSQIPQKGAVFGLVLVCLAGTPAEGRAEFVRQALSIPGSLLAVEYGDLNGDRRTDLVVSYRRGAGPDARRYIGVFLRSDKGYPGIPSIAFRAPARASLFDVGDALRDPGGPARDEIVYLTATGVFAQVVEGTAPRPSVRVVNVSTLAAGPEEARLEAWDFLRPAGPGGPLVLLVPGRRTLFVYRRGPAGFVRWAALSLGMFHRYAAESPTVRRTRRGATPGRGFSVRATTIVPTVDFVEQTGDDRLDIVSHYEDRVAVHPQEADGSFDRQPAHRQWFRMRTPSELETRDTALSAHVQDLDADGIADLALTKIGGGITTLKTEVRLYRGRPGGGFQPEPAQRFTDDGFAVLTQYTDVDGDGRLEMVHPRSEVSIVSMTRAMLSSELSLDVRIRRSTKAGPAFFQARPVQALTARYGLDLTVGAAVRGAAPAFGHDFDGDGRRDALLSRGADKLGIFAGTARLKEPFNDDAWETLSVPGSQFTRVVPSRSDGRARPQVVVAYPGRRKLSGTLYVFVKR